MVAGGSGERFGRPKQFELLAGRRVLDLAVEAARSVASWVVVVLPLASVGEIVPGADAVVAGGETRSASVRAGLLALPAHCELVIVHDAARPLAPVELFAAVIAAVEQGADAAIPGVAVSDTLKRVEGGEVVATVERQGLVAVQTPQAFRRAVLVAAHASGGEGTDDAALVEALGARVVVVPGVASNLKLTTVADLVTAEALIRSSAPR